MTAFDRGRRLFATACLLLVSAVTPAAFGAAAAPAAAAAVPAALPPAAGGLSALARAGDGRLTFGIQTATAKKVDTRPAFTYSATAGAMVTDYVGLLNYADQPVTLKVYASDAFNTNAGGFDLLPADKTPHDVGAWVGLGQTAVTVPAKATVIIPFKLAVPADTTPGDHAGGIVASVTTRATDAKGNVVNVEQRVGLRVYLRVAGTLVAKLTIVNASATYHGTLNPFGTGRMDLQYTVRNEGNVRLAGRQAVRLSNVFGTTLRGSGFESLPELLPGNEYTVQVPISKVLPALRSSASVTLDPVAIVGDKNPPAPPATVRAAFWAVPWTLLAIIAVVVLLVVGFIIYSRVRAPRKGRPGGTAKKPGAHVAKVGAAAALLAVALLGTGVLPSARADAAPPKGSLLVQPYDGLDTSPPQVVTSGPCPGGDSIIARMKGPGFPAEGAVVRNNSPISLYQRTSAGGLVIPLSDTFKNIAGDQNPPVKLTGTYTITVACIQKLIFGTSLGDFTGTLKFASPTKYSYVGTRPSPEPSPSLSAPPATEGDPAQTFAAPPSPGTVDLAGSGSTHDEGGLLAAVVIFAVVATVVGGLLYFRRRPESEPS
ncbi:WxL protein peptidoglycan domain-containing protein [Hamadaea tsunoensis]|uniref:WxL protein peptidoglycan domain-containing protein n=1 Tax=Hamadaea tsunoensis TaxID=53368 RepID=UPI000417F23E|nr:DUF916 domain-containing protein [Hamadaea tsunoensis]